MSRGVMTPEERIEKLEAEISDIRDELDWLKDALAYQVADIMAAVEAMAP